MRRFSLAWILMGAALGSIVSSPSATGQILRWDDKTVIPGTENITPGPGLQIPGALLNRPLLAQFDLTGANFAGARLIEPSFSSAILRDANFENASINGANLWGVTRLGFTKEQFYSTASYRQKNLNLMWLSYNDLQGWDFSGQTLRNARFLYSSVEGANFTDANVGAIDLTGVIGFTAEQYRSTASYKNKQIGNAVFTGLDLTGFDFSGHLASTVNFENTRLPGVSFFGSFLGSGRFSGADAAGANFSFANLEDANFQHANVSGADFTNAFISGTGFSYSTGFTQEQLRSTAAIRTRLSNGSDSVTSICVAGTSLSRR